jgi:hypothetical protein
MQVLDECPQPVQLTGLSTLRLTKFGCLAGTLGQQQVKKLRQRGSQFRKRLYLAFYSLVPPMWARKM